MNFSVFELSEYSAKELRNSTKKMQLLG